MGAHRRLPRPQQGSGQPRRETFGRRNLAVGRGRGRRGAPEAVRTRGPRLLTPVRAPAPEPSSQLPAPGLRFWSQGQLGQPARGARSSGRASPRTRDAPQRRLRTPRPPPAETYTRGRPGGSAPRGPSGSPRPPAVPPHPPAAAAPLPPRPSPQRRAAEGRAGSGAARSGAAEGGRIVPPSRLGGTLNCSRRPPPAPAPQRCFPPPEEPGRGRLSAPPRARAPTGGA